MRRLPWYLIFTELCAFAVAISVDDIRARACEWENPIDSGVQLMCDAEINRVRCYPSKNCENGVSYGIFLREWVLKCPELMVVEYNKHCGHYVESSSMSSTTYAIIVGSIVIGALLVLTSGACLIFYFPCHIRRTAPAKELPLTFSRSPYAMGAAPCAYPNTVWHPNYNERVRLV